LNDAAFGQPGEGLLVDALRACCDEIVSLVAERNGEIAGHIFFSPVILKREDEPNWVGMGLGPMSVLPADQNQGIGSQLVQDGLDRMKAAGWPFVVVLGHPEFYPRFGFERASKYRVRCPWEVPDEVFMIAVFDATRQIGGGTAYYRDEFGAVI